MTATRDRRSDPELDAELAWDDRPIIGQFPGLPWWGAVALAFVPTAIAAFVDMQQQDTLGRLYQIVFVVCCLAAVCLVRRRSLFGPIVQPPLIFAITAIGAVAFLGPASSGGLKGLALSVALPLTSNFPTMGITTAVVVGIGAFRLWWQRDPDPDVRPNRPKAERPARDVELGLDDEPGQSTGGRGARERPAKDRAAAPARRGRPEPDDAPAEDRPRRDSGRSPRPAREPGGREGARGDSGRESRPRREPAAGRPERGDRDRGRGEPPADGARGRGRGRPADPQPRRREPGADGGRGRDDRGSGPRREGGRDGGSRDSGSREGGSREGREGRDTSGRQPRRRPPEGYR